MATWIDELEDDASHYRRDLGGELLIGLSIAVSLKRIADALFDDDGAGVSVNVDRIVDRLTYTADNNGFVTESVTDILKKMEGGR